MQSPSPATAVVWVSGRHLKVLLCPAVPNWFIEGKSLCLCVSDHRTQRGQGDRWHATATGMNDNFFTSIQHRSTAVSSADSGSSKTGRCQLLSEGFIGTWNTKKKWSSFVCVELLTTVGLQQQQCRATVESPQTSETSVVNIDNYEVLHITYNVYYPNE